MYAIRVGSDNYVKEFRYCTLWNYGRDPTLSPTPDADGNRWVWVDRTAFWTPEEHRDFLNNYTAYCYIDKVRTIRHRYVPSTT